MTVLILAIICAFCAVNGQNNNHYGNSDAVIFPGPVSSPRIPRVSIVSARSSDVSHNLLQKSLLLAKQMNELDTVNDFLNLVIGIPETEKTDFFSNRMGDERSSAIKPKPAKCMPELQSVSLLPENHDHSIVYIPSCTRIKRCGGCCNHPLLSCQPVPNTSETRNFEVIVSKPDVDGKLRYSGKKVVPLEEHTKCKCDCKKKAEHCTKSQIYSESDCQCVCKNTDEEEKCKRNHEIKLWDPESCLCACRNQSECGSGLFFNLNTCRCEKRGFSVQNWYENDRRVDYSLLRTNEKEYPIIIPLDASDPRRRHKDEPGH